MNSGVRPPEGITPIRDDSTGPVRTRRMLARFEARVAAEPSSGNDLRVLLQDWHRDRATQGSLTIGKHSTFCPVRGSARPSLGQHERQMSHLRGFIERQCQADHVLAHSAGGGNRLEDNYLPAHALCNNYRWDYLSELEPTARGNERAAAQLHTLPRQRGSWRARSRRESNVWYPALSRDILDLS